jgi:hypothetical protein
VPLPADPDAEGIIKMVPQPEHLAFLPAESSLVLSNFPHLEQDI